MFQVFGSIVPSSLCILYAPLLTTLCILNGPSQFAISLPCPCGFRMSSTFRSTRSPSENVLVLSFLLYFRAIARFAAVCCSADLSQVSSTRSSSALLFLALSLSLVCVILLFGRDTSIGIIASLP
ncbi:uncharacterized protein DS421_14g471630 [Arachis hypogaea]|nr:uncharacterized protein DS421_14g471630 [Arachis hypogaea]